MTDHCGAETGDGGECRNPAGDNGRCWIPTHNDSDEPNPQGRPTKFDDEAAEHNAEYAAGMRHARVIVETELMNDD